MRFEMTFLIKNKMEKKNKLVNFGPHCFMGKIIKKDLLSHRSHI